MAQHELRRLKDRVNFFPEKPISIQKSILHSRSGVNRSGKVDRIVCGGQSPVLDFANPESVAKWSAEMLAEINSLSNRLDNGLLHTDTPENAAFYRLKERPNANLEEVCAILRGIGESSPTSESSNITQLYSDSSMDKSFVLLQSGMSADIRRSAKGTNTRDDGLSGTGTRNSLRTNLQNTSRSSLELLSQKWNIVKRHMNTAKNEVAVGVDRFSRHSLRRNGSTATPAAQNQTVHMRPNVKEVNNLIGRNRYASRRINLESRHPKMDAKPPSVIEPLVEANSTTAVNQLNSSTNQETNKKPIPAKRLSLLTKSIQHDGNKLHGEELTSNVPEIPHNLREVETQTSPLLSLSSSSSFSWMSEEGLEKYHDNDLHDKNLPMIAFDVQQTPTADQETPQADTSTDDPACVSHRKVFNSAITDQHQLFDTIDGYDCSFLYEAGENSCSSVPTKRRGSLPHASVTDVQQQPFARTFSARQRKPIPTRGEFRNKNIIMINPGNERVGNDEPISDSMESFNESLQLLLSFTEELDSSVPSNVYSPKMPHKLNRAAYGKNDCKLAYTVADEACRYHWEKSSQGKGYLLQPPLHAENSNPNSPITPTKSASLTPNNWRPQNKRFERTELLAKEFTDSPDERFIISGGSSNLADPQSCKISGYSPASTSSSQMEPDYFCYKAKLLEENSTGRETDADNRFPIDVQSVQRDHQFLDRDSLRALFKRLHMLNRCAMLKNQSDSTQDTKPEEPVVTESDDDLDETVALSRDWYYDKKTKTWTRIASNFAARGNYNNSEMQQLDDLMDDLRLQSPWHRPKAERETMEPPKWAVSRSANNNADYTSPRQDGVVKPENDNDLLSDRSAGCEFLPDPIDDQSRLQRSQSERIKDHTKAFMRRMGFIRKTGGSTRRRRESRDRYKQRRFAEESTDFDISSPRVGSRQVGTPTSSRQADVENGAYLAHTSSTDTANTYTPLMHNSDTANTYPPVLHNSVRSTGVRTSARSPASFQCSAETDINYVLKPKMIGDSPCSIAAHRSGPALMVFNPIYTPTTIDSGELRCSCHGTSPSDGRQLLAGDFLQRAERSFEGAVLAGLPERRDSGVGSSLSRSPSCHPKTNCTDQGKDSKTDTSIDSLTVAEIMACRKLSLLKLTALLEKYVLEGQNKKSHPILNWGANKFFSINKNEISCKDYGVFGVPLHTIAQRQGRPLPDCILHFMQFLSEQVPHSVGLFRKPGLKSRIQKLRQACEENVALPAFTDEHAYDIADLMKQYFRELPEPLLTKKLSETFIAIQMCVPENLQVEALQQTLMLLPDENREVLQTLLAFLDEISTHKETNQMSARNLAMCFAPSLFYLGSRNNAPSNQHKTGLLTEGDLKNNSTCQSCLTRMIQDWKRLFLLPESMKIPPNTGSPSIYHLTIDPFGEYLRQLEAFISSILKEHRDRWKGWMTEGSEEHVEISCKNSPDNSPLKVWRCWTDVEAPPNEVLTRILRERDLWDNDVLKWRLVRKVRANCEIFQFVQNDMPPHPTRDYSIIRLWQRNLTELRGGCVLVEAAVADRETSQLGGIRASCLASRYLIEPSSAGRSRVTYLARMDTRGRGKRWYNKIFGYNCARHVANLRDSFRQGEDEGPETKV